MAINTVLVPPQTSDPANFDSKADKFLTDLITWTDEANQTANALNLNATNGTSSTSVLIGTGSKTFTADTGKSWQLGMTLKIASTASPANNMTGDVTAYNSGTGSLTVNVTSTAGSGTLAAWTISQSGVGILPGYFVSGSDINITSSGSVTVPSIGTLFNLTAVAAFNITGFATTSNGREFSIRSNPDKLLTLVNSASLKLIGNTSRVMASGEVVHFTQTASGVYTEVGQQTIIDMTGYTGADIALSVGQVAIYDVSAITTLLLRIASGDNQEYSLKIRPTLLAGATIGVANLQPNNANTSAGGVQRNGYQTANAASITPFSTADSNFVLCAGATVLRITAEICTRTNLKSVESRYRNVDATTHYTGVMQDYWTSDTTTAWSSLGTLNFGAALTGRIIVKREF